MRFLCMDIRLFRTSRFNLPNPLSNLPNIIMGIITVELTLGPPLSSYPLMGCSSNPRAPKVTPTTTPSMATTLIANPRGGTPTRGYKGRWYRTTVMFVRIPQTLTKSIPTVTMAVVLTPAIPTRGSNESGDGTPPHTPQTLNTTNATITKATGPPVTWMPARGIQESGNSVPPHLALRNPQALETTTTTVTPSAGVPVPAIPARRWEKGRNSTPPHLALRAPQTLGTKNTTTITTGTGIPISPIPARSSKETRDGTRPHLPLCSPQTLIKADKSVTLRTGPPM